MRAINKLIIHCSDSDFGDAKLIKEWHTNLPPKGNGWTDIGYHYIILNGHRKRGIYIPEDDGKIEVGRPIEIPGAHCRGHNKVSVGVCIIGRRLFSAKQLYESLPEIIRMIGTTVDIEVYGHYEFTDRKSCPNINMEVLRNLMNRFMLIC